MAILVTFENGGTGIRQSLSNAIFLSMLRFYKNTVLPRGANGILEYLIALQKINKVYVDGWHLCSVYKYIYMHTYLHVSLIRIYVMSLVDKTVFV